MITGAAGFLGKHLVQLFSNGKNELVTIARPTSNIEHLEKAGVEIIRGDLHDAGCIKAAAKGAEVIIHAAATLRGTWDDFDAINVRATQHLLEAAVANKCQRFVFISSIIVYDHSNADLEAPFSEELPYEETNLTYYSKTKIAAEKLVQQYHEEKKLATTVLRPAAIYGKGGPLFLSRLGFAAGDRRYLVVGHGKLPLPLSHVEGIAEAVKLCIEKDRAVGQTYNVVEDEVVSQNDYFNEVKRYVLPKLSTVKMPYGLMKFLSQSADKVLGLAGMTSPLPMSYMKLCATPYAYSNEKIKQELGWRPQADFRESLREMMLSHKEARLSKRKLENDDHRVPILATARLRVGVVGCGVISGPHLKALKKLANTSVVAVCDPVLEARQATADMFKVPKAYETYAEMFENEDLDIVHVCTPAQSHAEVSIAAMKQGCHVFVEKPFACNAAEAKKMIAAAKRYKVKLSVDHNHVFDKVMIKARNIIASGELGRISYVESWYGTSYSSDSKSRYLTYDARNNWAYNMPGSLYQNFISHPISLLLDVMGEARVESVQSKFHRIVPHMPTDELRVTFENDDMVGLLSLSMAVSPRYLFVNIYGTAGTLRIDLLNKTVFLDKPSAKLPRVISRSMSSLSQAKVLLGAAVGNTLTGLVGRYNMYQGNETLIRLFYKSILEKTPEPISAEEALRSMEIMDEIWQKMADREAHDVTFVKDGTKSNGSKTVRTRTGNGKRQRAKKAPATQQPANQSGMQNTN